MHGKILRSPHAHAQDQVDRHLGGREAARRAGRRHGARLSEPEGQDRRTWAKGSVNLAHLGANVLAHGKVLYKGHAVAAVAAANPHIAEEALKLIKVEYEPLPPVTWVLDAMTRRRAAAARRPAHQLDGQEGATSPPTSPTHIHFETGNVDEAFAKADVVIEREFNTASVHQGYIEPHVATALWNADGHLTIWTTTQGSFTARQQTAELLQIPVSQVTVVPCEIGGGFGGKIAVYLEPVAALLSRKCGRPVKMAMNRAEVFEGTGPTPGSFIRVKLGATKDGKLMAGEAWLAYDAGAFPGGMIGPGCMCVFSCYEFPNARVDGYDVVVNKPKTQAYRAPGATQAAFACESVIDELAEKLGIDPIEFRLKNAAKEGTRRVDGPVYPRIGFIETLRSGPGQRPLEDRRSTGPNRGRGIASGFWFNIGLKIERRGQRQPRRHGQPGRRLDRHRRHAHQRSPCNWPRRWASRPRTSSRTSADTDSVGYTDVTGGSRVTFATGPGRLRGGPRHPAADGRARRHAVGVRADRRRRATTAFTSPTASRITFKELAGKLSADRRAGRRPRGGRSRRARPTASARTSSTSRSIPRRAR